MPAQCTNVPLSPGVHGHQQGHLQPAAPHRPVYQATDGQVGGAVWITVFLDSQMVRLLDG